jgi:beta-glucuronidase
MKHLFLSAVFLLFPAILPAVTHIDLNQHWSFRIDPAASGESSGWQKQLPDEVLPISVPHTWNIGKYDDYEGIAWYFRTFEIPAELSRKHIELHFNGTFYSTHVWLNGIEIGSHEGGYTAYYFDISAHLQPVNYLAVEIDNRPSASTIPGLAMRLRSSNNVWYDWWHYGGIVRDVFLTMNEPLLIRRQQIRSEISGTSATLQDEVFLENSSKQSAAVILRLVALDPEGQTAAETSETFSLPPGGSNRVVSLKLANIHRWSIDQPNLYRLSLKLESGGKVLDAREDTFGLRQIEIRDRHLLINGERVRLSGMTRHEESPWEGLAETPGTMRRDYDDMKALQVTLTRPVHYPQNSYIFDYADRNGMLFIPEIPVWQFSEKQLSDPKVLALAKQQMREMIEQNANHPSIFAWSVSNESEMSTPGGRAYFKTMRDMIREIDPDRFVSFADDSLPAVDRAEDAAAQEADFLMMNQYFGSWAGPKSGLAPALDKINRLFPGKMLIISEFGTPAIFAADSVAGDRLRVETIREQMAEFARRDWIAGAIFWCYQDYKSHRNLWPGVQEGYVDIGVVDEYRQRRPSYQVWNEANAPATLAADWNEWAYKVPSAFTITVTPKSEKELPSYPLHDYLLRWELRAERSTLIAKGEKGFPLIDHAETITGELPGNLTPRKLTLHVQLVRPTGFTAAERTFEWRHEEDGGQTIPEMKGLVVPKE